MTKQERLNNELIDIAEYGNLEIVKNLIKQGADINAKDDDGNTVLMWSSREGHLDIVKFLIDKGADIEIKNSNGESALMINAKSTGSLKVIKYLLDNGADINAENAYGETAYTYIKINNMLDDLIPYIYDYKAFENIYNDLTIEQKHVLFEHFMKNRELLEQVNPRIMKGFIPDINKYKNNLK